MTYQSSPMWIKKAYVCFMNLLLALGLCLNGESLQTEEQTPEKIISEWKVDATNESEIEPTYLMPYYELDLKTIPEYNGEPYYIINDNVPFFTEEDKYNPSFELYSEMDELGRCGVASAIISKDLMPTEPRSSIGNIKPSGWHTVKYPDLISDLYLYNRCHLIAYSLAGENANECNLITGTRYMNVTGMLPFENLVKYFVEVTEGKVMYRVTPCFEGDELVARGVHMEGFSLDDDGQSVCFNVFVYNVQPGIVIDYATGDSHAE